MPTAYLRDHSRKWFAPSKQGDKVLRYYIPARWSLWTSNRLDVRASTNRSRHCRLSGTHVTERNLSISIVHKDSIFPFHLCGERQPLPPLLIVTVLHTSSMITLNIYRLGVLRDHRAGVKAVTQSLVLAVLSSFLRMYSAHACHVWSLARATSCRSGSWLRFWGEGFFRLTFVKGHCTVVSTMWCGREGTNQKRKNRVMKG